jgi:hypothetical protein
MLCNHTGCAGRSEGENLAVLMEAGVLGWADLDAIEGHINAARLAAVASLPPIDDALFEDHTEVGDGIPREGAGTAPGAAEGNTEGAAGAPPTPSNWRDLDPREEVAKWIARLNRDYMIIGDGGPSVIEERFDPELCSYSYISYKPRDLPTLFDQHRFASMSMKKVVRSPRTRWSCG